MLECLRLATIVVPNGVADKAAEVLITADKLFEKIVSIDSRNLLHLEGKEVTVIADGVTPIADTQKRRGRPPKSK